MFRLARTLIPRNTDAPPKVVVVRLVGAISPGA
jgi:hypothetical protein